VKQKNTQNCVRSERMSCKCHTSLQLGDERIAHVWSVRAVGCEAGHISLRDNLVLPVTNAILITNHERAKGL
jgi:hypothetical protein